MKLISLPGIFLLILALLSGSCLNKGNIKDSKAESPCYVYISVSKEKKIAVFKLNTLNGSLDLIENHVMTGEPGSLCANPSNKSLYAALRSTKSVASLNIDPKTGKLSYMKDTPVADNPVYISTDKTGKFLFITSYSGNKTAVYPVDNGIVNPNAVQVMEARLNPHMIKTDPSGKYILVPNLGGELVQQFILQGDGSLKPNTPDAMPVKSISGPRHFIFHPSKDIMYLLNEKACTVNPFNFDPSRGILSGPFQEISTLPVDFTLANSCADIHITPDGKYLYASNRGHNSLAAFKVDPGNGTLSLIGHFPTEKTPREFEIDPSGRFIIAAGEGSGNIALYRIQENGSLLLLNTYAVGSWPVWVTVVKP